MGTDKISALEQLIAAYHDPHLIREDDENSGWPVFGYLSEHVPLEMIYAADILPVKIQSGSSAKLASMHLQSFSCGYARGAIHRAMNAEYDYLNGIVVAKACDVSLSLFQIWQDLRPPEFSWLISLPGNCDHEAIDYLEEEFSHIKSALAEYRKIAISDQKLSVSISLYNQLRQTVLQLWRKRDEGSVALTAGDLIRALRGSQVMPPTASLRLLNALLGEGEEEGGISGRGPRLMLLGSSYADVSLVDMIERSGGRVVLEETTTVGRHFGLDVDPGEDPLRALASYYACAVSGCFRLTYEERWQHILRLIEEWDIQGCINIIQRCCDTTLFESPLLKESFKDLGVPYFAVEIDDTSPGLKQMKTRVEAFVEMVGGI